MPDTYTYPAKIELDEDGRFLVTFPDFGWGATDGATLGEALAEARDLLRELMAQTMREGRPLPAPSRRAGASWHLVTPPAPVARQAAQREARWRDNVSTPAVVEVEHVGQGSARYRRG